MGNENNQIELVVINTEKLIYIISQAIKMVLKKELPNEKEEEVYLSTKEAQKFLKIGHSTIHRFMNDGKLKPVRFGRKLLFKKSDLLKEAETRRDV